MTSDEFEKNFAPASACVRRNSRTSLVDEGSIETFWASHPAEDRTSRSVRLAPAAAFAAAFAAAPTAVWFWENVLFCDVTLSNMRRAGLRRVPKFETFAEITR